MARCLPVLCVLLAIIDDMSQLSGLVVNRRTAASAMAASVEPYVIYVNKTILLSNWPYQESDEPRVRVLAPVTTTPLECTIDTICRYIIGLDRQPPSHLEAEVEIAFERDPESTSVADFFFVIDDPLLPSTRRYLQSGA